MQEAGTERFETRSTYWTFLAVSNGITADAIKTLQQIEESAAYFHEESNMRIGLSTWAEIINSSRARFDGFRARLDYMATRDEGVALLHAKYKKYLPDSFPSLNLGTARAVS